MPLSVPRARISSCTVLMGLAAGLPAQLHAEKSNRTYFAALSVAADDADSNSLAGELGFSLGERGWTHFGLGNSSAALADDSSIDTTVGSVLAGYDGEHLEFQAGFSYREDGTSMQQQDYTAALSYRGAQARIGVDFFYRTASSESTASIERRFREPLSIRILESFEGTGIGLHASIDATEHLRLFAGGKAYDYASSNNLPNYVLRLRRLNFSGVTREEAFLKNSMNAGLSYGFDAVSLSARYIRDRTLDTDDITHTTELSADVPLNDQWSLAPWLGYSSNDLLGEAVFGGVQVSVFW